MRLEHAARPDSAMARLRSNAVTARILFVAMAVVAWTGAGADPAPVPAGSGADTVVIVVRHAEKVLPADAAASTMADENPPLTPAGERRAAAIAEALADAGIAAVYSTPYRRTMQTAAPLAARAGVAVTSYDSHLDPSEFARQVTAAHRGATVLVVGHSNTVPGLVAAFAGKPIEGMDDSVYGRVYLISIAADGKARLLRMGFPPYATDAE